MRAGLSFHSLIHKLMAVLDDNTLVAGVNALAGEVVHRSLNALSLNGLDAGTFLRNNQLNLCQREAETLEAETVRLQVCKRCFVNGSLEMILILIKFTLFQQLNEVNPLLILEDRIVFSGYILY